MKKVDEITLEELDLSVRAYSILKRKKIQPFFYKLVEFPNKL